jgi:hypothetical protein
MNTLFANPASEGTNPHFLGPRFWTLFVLAALPSAGLGWALGLGLASTIGLAIVLGGVAAWVCAVALSAREALGEPTADAIDACGRPAPSGCIEEAAYAAAVLTVPEVVIATKVAGAVIDGVDELRRGPIELGLTRPSTEPRRERNPVASQPN